MKKEQRDSWLNTPPLAIPKPPVITRAQILPFDQLQWQDFERLCCRLARKESNVEDCNQYGVQGELQSGIDIFARIANSEKYRVYQCKNEASFGPAKIKKAVEKFINGEWLVKSQEFVLCTRGSMRNTERREEVEKQVLILKSKGISFLCWDAEELSLKLKLYPEIVDDFFDRPWVKAFCGEDVANRLEERLDAKTLKELRSRLLKFYTRIFNFHDPGIPIPGVLPLSKRYVVPDVENLQVIDSPASPSAPNSGTTDNPELSQQSSRKEVNPSRSASMKSVRKYTQRIPIQNWIVGNKKSLLFGDPGSGKSSFLKFLALDVLNDTPSLEYISEKWGYYIPVLIPFALWTKEASRSTSKISVKEIIKSYFKSWGEDDLLPLFEKALKDKRLLLLLDGLDEHSSVEASKIVLNRLELFLEENDINIIATTRPHGFEKLGMNVGGWKQTRIADFSLVQQIELAEIWFEANNKKVNPNIDDITCSKDVERQVDTFFTELSPSDELKELAKNPLLLCLLISFQIGNIRLPLGRFKAYQALTNHLISIHPQKRLIAADATGTNKVLFNEYLEKALAHLAYKIQTEYPDGIILEDEALKKIKEFLTNDQHGFGMDASRAFEIGKVLLSTAEDNIGIIIKRSQNEISFYHRTIQEYLVSFNISRLAIEKQIEIISQRCTDPLWREVVLGLFQITKPPDVIRQLVQAIQSRSISCIEKKIVEDILSEIAFGNFNCPPSLAKELGKDTIYKIEHDTWIPHREKLLKHVLDGLRSPVMVEVVKEKIKEWFPCRFAYHQLFKLFEAMKHWEPTDDMIETLFKGLNHEEYITKQVAAFRLVEIAHSVVAVKSRLDSIISHSDDPFIIAALMEAFVSEWKDHPSFQKLTEQIVKSPNPELRLIGIRGRIALNNHNESDLNNLLVLSNINSRISDSYIGYIIQAFLDGWPRNEKIKQKCLKSLNPWIAQETEINKQIAASVLLRGYPMDNDVVDFCAEALEAGRHPFISFIGNNTFELFKKNFGNHPKIAKAFDNLAQKKNLEPASIYLVTMFGKTSIYKKKLLKDLMKEPDPSFSAEILLEVWGMQDAEVSIAFNEMIKKNPNRTFQIAHLLSKIIP